MRDEFSSSATFFSCRLYNLSRWARALEDVQAAPLGTACTAKVPPSNEPSLSRWNGLLEGCRSDKVRQLGIKVLKCTVSTRKAQLVGTAALLPPPKMKRLPTVSSQLPISSVLRHLRSRLPASTAYGEQLLSLVLSTALIADVLVACGSANWQQRAQ